MKKTILELQTYQQAGFGGVRTPSASLEYDQFMPKVIRDVYQFWGITRAFFDAQARDLLKLLESPSESDTFGYNQFELHSQKFTLPQVPSVGGSLANS